MVKMADCTHATASTWLPKMAENNLLKEWAHKDLEKKRGDNSDKISLVSLTHMKTRLTTVLALICRTVGKDGVWTEKHSRTSKRHVDKRSNEVWLACQEETIRRNNIQETSKMNDRYQTTIPKHSKNTKQKKCSPPTRITEPKAYSIQTAKKQGQREN